MVLYDSPTATPRTIVRVASGPVPARGCVSCGCKPIVRNWMCMECWTAEPGCLTVSDKRNKFFVPKPLCDDVYHGRRRAMS